MVLACSLPGGLPSVAPARVSRITGWPATLSLIALPAATAITVVQGLVVLLAGVEQRATDFAAIPASTSADIPWMVSFGTPVTLIVPAWLHCTLLDAVSTLLMAQLTSIALVTCTATSIALSVIFASAVSV